MRKRPKTELIGTSRPPRRQKEYSGYRSIFGKAFVETDRELSQNEHVQWFPPKLSGLFPLKV